MSAAMDERMIWVFGTDDPDRQGLDIVEIHEGRFPGFERSAVQRALRRLLYRGVIEKDGPRHYRLTARPVPASSMDEVLAIKTRAAAVSPSEGGPGA